LFYYHSGVSSTSDPATSVPATQLTIR